MHPLWHLAPAAVLILLAFGLIYFTAEDWSRDALGVRYALASGAGVAVLLAATVIALHPVIAWSFP